MSFVNFLIFFLMVKTYLLIDDIIYLNILITYYKNGVAKMKDMKDILNIRFTFLIFFRIIVC